MKIEFDKNCNLYLYKWHSINLVPMISIHNVASDLIDLAPGCQGWDATLVGRSIEITFFGFILNFMYPNTKFKKQWFSKSYGPLWSRRRKCWYRPND